MPRVLIVEDEFLVRDLAEQDFADSGFETVAAEDARVAIGVLQSQPPFDLILTDIRMPGGMDGWELGRVVRSEYPEVKVIYATGYSEQTRPLATFERFIRKPYRIGEILALARELGVQP